MGYKMLNAPERGWTRREYGVLGEDFASFTDTQLWTVAVVATGTVTHEGSTGRSALKFFNTAVNDKAVLATTNEIFKFKASKPMYAEAYIIFTDVDTDDGMVGFGWADALAATTMADTTGAITATDACMIYKLPDTTVWAFHTEINGAAQSTVSDSTAGGTAYQRLSIDVIPRSSTVFEARPFLDGVQLKTATGVPIMHTITLGTATDLDFGIITGSIDAADFNVYCDYIFAKQLRD